MAVITESSRRKSKLLLLFVVSCVTVLSGCNSATSTPVATPTVDPAIYNQVPKTTTFFPNECIVVLTAATRAYMSNTIGGESTATVPAGTYSVAIAAEYETSVWYQLNGVSGANFINSTSVSSTQGDCSTDG